MSKAIRGWRVPNRYDVTDNGDGLLIMTRPEGRGEDIALFDLADLPLVQRVRWMVNPKGYVTGRLGSGPDLQIFKLHREVLGLKRGDGLVGDHIDGDRLNNRRWNLRAVTNQRNVAHQAVVNTRGTSRFRGVSWDAGRRRWLTSVTLDGRRCSMGRFDSEEAAAEAVAAFRAEHGIPTGY